MVNTTKGQWLELQVAESRENNGRRKKNLRRVKRPKGIPKGLGSLIYKGPKP